VLRVNRWGGRTKKKHKEDVATPKGSKIHVVYLYHPLAATHYTKIHTPVAGEGEVGYVAREKRRTRGQRIRGSEAKVE
jgi:hypothetical protein